MASFSDYIKEMEQTTQETKDTLINQLCVLRDNLDLMIEELKSIKNNIKEYDYLYILVKLRVAKEHLEDATDILYGWYPEDEENIPADMVFEEGDPDEQDR